MGSLRVHLSTGLSTGNQVSKACAFTNEKQDTAATHILASAH